MRVARPRTLRRGCASAQRTVRAVRSTHRGPSTGGVAPGRFRGVWLHRSPPRPSMHGPFGVHRGPRGPYDRGARHAKACVRDPPDLDADSPVASRFHAVRPAGRTASLGFVQRSPLHRPEPESPTPGSRVSAVAFGEEPPAPPACRPRGFAPPRRFVPLRSCRFVAPCSRSWGSPCFIPSRNGVLTVRLLPFEAFPPSTAADPGRHLSVAAYPRARVTEAPIAGRLLHRVPCLLTLLLRAACGWFPISRPARSPASVARSRGLEALLHLRVRCLHVRCHT